MLDFNGAENQGDLPRKIDKEAIRTKLFNSVEDALFYLFPKGHVRNQHFQIGSTKGEAGKSLVVDLKAENQGRWFDFAENDGGDIFSLWELYIKLPISTSKFGIVCVEGMEFPFGDDAPQEVLPTHFKCPNTGNTIEINDDQAIWSYEDEERGEENE